MSSIRLSVCNVGGSLDQEHIGWKYWQLIERTIFPTPSLFVAQKDIHAPTHLLTVTGRTWGNFGEIRGGWEKEKVACWSTKAAISLKRVKIEEKLLRNYRNSPTFFRMVPSTNTYGLIFPKIGRSQPPPKNSIAVISGTGRAIRTSSLAGTFTGSIHTKTH